MGSCSNTDLDTFLFEYKFSVFMLSKFLSTFASLLMESSCYFFVLNSVLLFAYKLFFSFLELLLLSKPLIANF